jgi:hypothetical protein
VKRGSLRELKEKKKEKITRRLELWSFKSPMMSKNDYHCQSRKEKKTEKTGRASSSTCLLHHWQDVYALSRTTIAPPNSNSFKPRQATMKGWTFEPSNHDTLILFCLWIIFLVNVVYGFYYLCVC